jgi:hypothetical protein
LRCANGELEPCPRGDCWLHDRAAAEAERLRAAHPEAKGPRVNVLLANLALDRQLGRPVE